MNADRVNLCSPVGTAVFSPCMTYRYLLTRDLAEPDLLAEAQGVTPATCLFLMLNPSTADHELPDRTITRCMGFARSWGYNRLEVANLFALRSTDPAALKTHRDPVGPLNDTHIVEAARRADLVVCAWGQHGAFVNRATAVLHLLRPRQLHHLKLSKDGQPGHPLYLRAELKPQPWAR